MSMIQQLIREGLVTSVDAKTASVRVTFPDRDNLVSAALPVLIPATSNKFFALPSVGDSVLCLMTPNAQDGTGYVLGSFYHDKTPPPTDKQHQTLIRFKDGTRLCYDDKAHRLEVSVAGEVFISGDTIHIQADDDVFISGERVVLSGATETKVID